MIAALSSRHSDRKADTITKFEWELCACVSVFFRSVNVAFSGNAWHNHEMKGKNHHQRLTRQQKAHWIF